MTGEQDLFGIGKGAAQVMNTNRSLQTFFAVQQRRMLLEQRDNMMLQEMVAGYDPSKQKGLQGKDVADYQQLYTAWKGLHLQNKDLMKNPGKYPDQYKAAEEIKRRMLTVARLSEQDAAFNGNASQAFFKDPDKYQDGSVELVYKNRNVPVLQQMRERGRLLDERDIVLNYQLPSTDVVQKYVKETAEGMPNGASYGREVIKKGGSEGLALWQNMVQDYTKFNPEAVELAFGTAVNYDRNILKAYNQQFASMSPQQIAAKQQEVKTFAGVDFPITNGEQLGKADFMVRGGMVREKPKVEEDKELMRKMEMQDYQIKLGMQEAKDRRMENLRTANDIKLKQIQGPGEKPFDAQLMDYSKSFVDDLNRSNSEKVTEKVRSLFKRTYPPNGAPRVLNPRSMTKEQYKAQYKKYLADAYEGTDKLFARSGEELDRDDAWIDGAYGSGRSVMFLPVQWTNPKTEKTEKKFVVIDPKDPTASERLFYMLNNGFQFSAKQTPEQLGTGRK